jgi:hypothetical protein
MGRLLEATCDKTASGPGRRPRRGRCSGEPWAAACRPRADPTGSPAAAPASPRSSDPLLPPTTTTSSLLPCPLLNSKNRQNESDSPARSTHPHILRSRQRRREIGRAHRATSPPTPARSVRSREETTAASVPCSQQSSPGRRGNGKKTRLNGLHSYPAHI